jgi:hypothetical protein
MLRLSGQGKEHQSSKFVGRVSWVCSNPFDQFLRAVLVMALASASASVLASTSFTDNLNISSNVNLLTGTTSDPNSVSSVRLLGTSWNNTATLGSISPLNYSYKFYGKTGTYKDSFGITWPKIGWKTYTGNLGSIGAAIPLSASGSVGLNLYYGATSSNASLTYPYDTNLTVTQVNDSIYRIDTSATLVRNQANINSNFELPQAKIDAALSYSFAVGDAKICAGVCTTIDTGYSIKDTKAATLMSYNWNDDGKATLLGPNGVYSVAELPPSGSTADFAAGETRLSFSLPRLSINASADQSGLIRGEATSTFADLTYDVASLTPFSRYVNDRGSYGVLDWSYDLHAALISMKAGVQLGLKSVETFSGDILGKFRFGEIVDQIKETASGFEKVASGIKDLVFTPGESIYIDTHGSDIAVDTSYSLDGEFTSKYDLVLNGILQASALEAWAKAKLSYDIPIKLPFIGTVHMKDSKSVSQTLGPLWKSSVSVPIGSVGLYSSVVPINVDDFASTQFVIDDAGVHSLTDNSGSHAIYSKLVASTGDDGNSGLESLISESLDYQQSNIEESILYVDLSQYQDIDLSQLIQVGENEWIDLRSGPLDTSEIPEPKSLLLLATGLFLLWQYRRHVAV